MGLPWWMWSLIVIVAIFLFMRSALKGFRRRTRREFIEAIKEIDPTMYLEVGEWIAAAIPDRDTLFLAPVPPDGDWSGMKKVARTTGPTGYRLLDRQLKVGREGIEVV